MEEITIGEIVETVFTFDGLANDRHFTDPDVEITLCFFVKDKRKDGEYTVEKADMRPLVDGDCDVFNAHLDTTALPTGQLCCEATITYPCYQHGDMSRLTNKPYVEYPNILVRRA